jgi:2,4-dienoyl-CoA reductase-like NADH-dependent reductase (Old Yellow Enzyme family)
LGLFNKPKALKKEEIHDIINRYVKTASLCKKAGFTGIQVHAAHGYLLSQFLSPITNKRNDEFGGNIENRSRILFEIIRKIRKEVGSQFPISVKLNSSDFQRGGFTEEESLEVIKRLDEAGIDLLEISGGTYEKVVFFMLNEIDTMTSERTKRREAYFIDFAKKVREITQLPLMITGGFRSYAFCNTCLHNEELDFIGMARPFLTNLPEISSFIKGKTETLDNFVIRTNIKALDDMAEAGNYALQIIRMSKGKSYKKNIGPLKSALYFLFLEVVKGLRKMV